MTSAVKSGSFNIGGKAKVTRLGFGAMRVVGDGVWGPPKDKAEALATLRRVPELGVDFIDTADAYGPAISEFGGESTAQLGGNAATVWGVPSKLKVTASGGHTYTPATADCGYLGSKQIDTPAAQNAGPGVTPDCGAVFQSPANWTLGASLTWQACWVAGVVDGPPPATCQPVAGAQLDATNWARPVTVNEIQSVDNGQGNG